jgi:tight adherence protein C
MSQVLVYLVGLGFGAGVLLCVSAFFPTPQPLSVAMARLQRVEQADALRPSWLTRQFGSSWTDTDAGRRMLRNTESDLRLCDMTAGEYLAQRVLCSAIAVLWAPFAVLLMAGVGVELPIVVPVWFSLILAPAGFFYPAISLRSKAKNRRRAFRHAFSSFLDIVSVSLAGGKGVEGALNDGANAGEAWVFERLRATLLEARLLGVTPWAGLERLGLDLDIPEVQELAASAALAGAEGARVRASISAKAKALRQHGLSDVEASAQSANERMSLPIVALMMGFVFFLGYPAVMAVAKGL